MSFNFAIKSAYPVQFPLPFTGSTAASINSRGIAMFAPLYADNDIGSGKVFYKVRSQFNSALPFTPSNRSTPFNKSQYSMYQYFKEKVVNL